MAEWQQLKNNNSNRRTSREGLVTSPRVPPPPPSYQNDQRRSSSYSYDHLDNITKTPTNQIYKTELIINPTRPTGSINNSNLCEQCSQTISNGEYTNYNGNKYHLDCFKCFYCQTPIKELQFSIQNSNRCCRNCYEQKFSPICQQCFKPITSGESIIYNQNKYHPDCFRCGQCSKTIRHSEFHTHLSKPCCIQCYEQSIAPKCQQCFKPIIQGKVIVFNENKYHSDCFRCGQCSKTIHDSEFHTHLSKPCCNQCYEESIAPKCQQCLKPIIQGKVIVFKENKYHPDCFRCGKCFQAIVESKFHMENDKPCCNQCHEKYFSFECSKCRRSIIGEYTIYQGKHFHINCFVCVKCHKVIREKEKFYDEQSGIVCSTCPI